MVKRSSGGKGAKAPVAAIAKKQQRRAPNKFETKKSKTRFDTVGRRLKGATKSIVKAREQAIEKRDKTLLIEYKQLRKANSFVDRRFGENDAQLTDDDKAFARLRAQRLKAKRTPLGGGGKKVKFALGGDDGDDQGLTHGGKSLAELDDLNEAPDMDDVDEGIYEEVMKDYNFGGGDDDETAKGPDGKPKTKKQVMDEIIARSKAFKAERQRQKEEDLETMKQLDDDYRTLLKAQALASFVKPKGFTKETKVKAATQEDADYDVAARELAFEGKGRAADRTLTAEEESDKKRQVFEQLEKERLRRMRGGLNDDEQEDGPGALGAAKGGYAARRAKIKAKMEGKEGSDDDEDDGEGEEGEDEEESDGEEGGSDEDDTKLQDRRMKRAAGSHPLQSALRAKAAELAAKYGLGKVRNPMLEDEDDEGEEDGEGDDSGDEGESGDGEEEAGSMSEDEAGDVSGGDEDGGAPQGSDGEGEDEEDDYEQELKTLQEAQPTRPAKDAKAGALDGAAAGQELEGPLDLPYTIPVPEAYEQFAALVKGRPADQLAAVVQRIRAFNTAALASDSKRKLQVFYGILVQHFAALAGEVPVPTAHLDAMVPIILQATAEVPYYAATVARTRLVRLHDRLSAALAGNAVAGIATNSKKAATKAGPAAPAAPESAWPAPRALLQLKLFTTLFPTSDRRHPVLTPALLLACRALAQCTANHVGEAAHGLILAGMTLHMTAPANRQCPEACTFLAHLLLSFCDPSAAPADDGDVLRRVAPGLLAPEAKGKALAKVTPSEVGLMDALALPVGSSSAPPTAPVVDDGFKLGLLSIALQAVSRAASVAAFCKESYPAATQQLRDALAVVGKALHLPPQLEQARSKLQAEMDQTAADATATRVPLARANGPRSAPVREFNPRFEEGYAKNRNYDPDRERAEQRRLKRDLAKERRGAIRELRKDAVYMSDLRDRERAQVDAERMDSQRKFYSELEKQQADLKSGGQGGMNPHLKKRRRK